MADRDVIPLRLPDDEESTIVLTNRGLAMIAEGVADARLIVPAKTPDLIRYGGNFDPPTEQESTAFIAFTTRRHFVGGFGYVPEKLRGMVTADREYNGTFIIDTPAFRRTLNTGRTTQISPYGGFCNGDVDVSAHHIRAKFRLPYRAFTYRPDGRRIKDITLTRGQTEFVRMPYLAGPNDRINLTRMDRA